MTRGIATVNPNSPVTEADINQAIASAVSAILRRGTLPSEMYSPPNLTTVSGANALEVDEEMGIIHRVWRLDGTKRIKLEWVSLDRLDDVFRYDGDTHATAKPLRWTFNNGKIELDPTPDDTYTIAYRGERVSGSIYNVPDDFRDIVINGALSVVIPAYIRPFERGLQDVARYYRKAKGKKRQWSHGSAVRAQRAERYSRNVN